MGLLVTCGVFFCTYQISHAHPNLDPIVHVCGILIMRTQVCIAYIHNMQLVPLLPSKLSSSVQLYCRKKLTCVVGYIAHYLDA